MSFQSIFFWCVLMLISFSMSTCVRPVENSLRFVIVTFRHGDRTPDTNADYTKDPYLNETYYPYGIGELTNKGKEREYELGKVLHNRYQNFLGKLYHYDIVNASSTAYRRTRASLELVLASLWPPEDTPLQWNNELNWQPIPYNIISSTESNMLSFPGDYCPKFKILYSNYMKTPQGRLVENKYNYAYEFLSEMTGLNITSIMDAFSLYFTLETQKEFGLELPIWSDLFYPDYLQRLATDYYVTYTATPALRRLTGGMLLKQIIRDFRRKMLKDPTLDKQKIILYSGHEYSAAFQLAGLKLYYPHIPSYSACVFLELHEINESYGVRVLYKQIEDFEPRILTIPGCTEICPFSQFEDLVRENVAKDDNVCNLK